MTTQDKIKMVEKLVANYKAMNEADDKMTQLLGIRCDSPAMNPSWAAFDGYVAAVTEAIGDNSKTCWCGWYIWENKCGEKGLRAQPKEGAKIRPIRTVKQLVKLIEEANK